MLFWTHLLSGIFGALLFLHTAENKIAFFLVCVFAALLPDVDSYNSKLGRKGISRTLMAFTKHRGFVHSLLFMGLLYLIMDKIWPAYSFAFLIGYSIHLILDCFTIRGIRLFYPFKLRLKFFVKSGGSFETILFVVLLIVDSFLLAARIVG